jgi:ribose transport system substrate-binding protein
MPRRAYLALAVACLALSGCGSKPNYKYRIAVIPKGLTHEFWQSIHRGADRAAADLKEKGLLVQVLWDGPTKEDEAQPQIDIVNNFVAQNVNGIVLAPQHSKTMIDCVRAANQQKIPVVIIDSGLDAPDQYVKYVATDNRNGGRLAATHLLKVLRAEGKTAPRIVLFRYQSGSESTMQREQGFIDVIDEEIAKQKQAGQPTITWVSKGELELGATKDQAEANARPLLSDKRDGIDGIFAPNESSASGVVEALRSLGLNKKVKLVGFDSSQPLVEALRAGDIDGLVLQDPYRMGYLGVWMMVQHLEGRNVAPDGKKNESTGEFVITRENIDSPQTRELFEEKAQAARTIRVPEYVK